MNKQLGMALAGLLCCVLVAGGAWAHGTPTINWWVISSAGGPSSGGDVTLNDTLGQPIVGPSSSGRVWLRAGYWGAGAAEEAAPPPPIAVGGYMVPVDRLGLLRPWMSLAAVMGLLLTGIVVALRRRNRRLL